MSDEPTLQGIIRLAATKEAEAYAFYADAATKADSPAAKALLLELANEELGHKERLEHVDPASVVSVPQEQAKSLGISEFLVDKPIRTDASFQDILIYAMKREERAERFFADISASMPAGDMKQLFRALQSEEARHKTRLERVYDDVIYKEN